MITETRKEVFTEKFIAGSRIYYFDVKESKDGARYLVISETKYDDTEHHRLMVFEESFEEFMDVLQKAAEFIISKPEKPKKAYHVETIRREFPNAYVKWTDSEDDELKEKFIEGMKIPELAKHFNRQENAIRSRLRKLELRSERGK